MEIQFFGGDAPSTPTISEEKEALTITSNLYSRFNQFSLFGGVFAVLGMNGPHNWGENEAERQEVFQHLKNDYQINFIIGLHEEEHFEQECQKLGIAYYYNAMKDFQKIPFSPLVLDSIHDVIQDQINNGARIAIHCGLGHGRTGMILASLKLRELIEEEFTQALFEFTDIIEKKHHINASTETIKIDCTFAVMQAILKIRSDREKSYPQWYGSLAVETDNEVETLINYEEHLRKRLKATLKSEVISFHSQDLNEIIGASLESIPQVFFEAPKETLQSVHTMKEDSQGSQSSLIVGGRFRFLPQKSFTQSIDNDVSFSSYSTHFRALD